MRSRHDPSAVVDRALNINETLLFWLEFLDPSYGYGDSHADLVWLELLGNPHAVNPDTQLQREAQRKHWKIDKWKRGNRSPKRDVIGASKG